MSDSSVADAKGVADVESITGMKGVADVEGVADVTSVAENVKGVEQGSRMPTKIQIGASIPDFFQSTPTKRPQQQQPLPPKVTGPPLSPEQQQVVDFVMAGKNVFFTGPAGTGKSFVMNRLKRLLVAAGKRAVFTATTGAAAILVGGCTIHSFASFTNPQAWGSEVSPAEAYTIIRKNSKAVHAASYRWCNTDILFIDEISMLDASMLDKLEFAARRYRRSMKVPWGGIQVVLSGDFLQLPPVQCTAFAFDSPAWTLLNLETVQLSRVFRQDGDDGFISLLHEVRLGSVSDTSVAILQRRARETMMEDMRQYAEEVRGGERGANGANGAEEAEEVRGETKGAEEVRGETKGAERGANRRRAIDDIIPTNLYATNAAVDNTNNRMLQKTSEESGNAIHTFTAEDSGKETFLLSNLHAAPVINLCVGAQVMLLCNLDVKAGLANGTRGVVVDIWFTGDRELKEGSEAKEGCEAKEGGGGAGTGDGTEDGNEDGQEQKRQKGQNGQKGQKGQKGQSFLQPQPHLRVRVKFVNGTVMIIKPHKWVFEDNSQPGKKLPPRAIRTQIPLRLAWALTVHKSQGMTLDSVRINCKGFRSEGQFYVALSRARSLQCIALENFYPGCIRASEAAIQFFRNMTRANNDVQSGRGEEVAEATQVAAEAEEVVEAAEVAAEAEEVTEEAAEEN